MYENLRDALIGLWCAIEMRRASEAMGKLHKRFNTRLGFPVVYCAPNRMSLTDNFKPWQKNARMTNDWNHVTCQHCINEYVR